MKNLLKTLLLLFCFLFCLNLKVNAQTYVTIPDANFVTWLQTNYPTCMNGNQMDITCSGIVNATTVDVSYKNIANLTGIEFFTNLTNLYCQSNNLSSVPALPSLLKTLNCSDNNLLSLPALPSLLKIFVCSGNNLTSLPALPSSIELLECIGNNLTSFPTLPSSLVNLNCSFNHLLYLPTLPPSIQYLNCNYNNLSSLPSLPESLEWLYCQYNQLTSLPLLPTYLNHLDCGVNQLTSLPPLNYHLQTLFCAINQLTSLPALPPHLDLLACFKNQLTSIPPLPEGLRVFGCANNQLTNLPTLPNSLQSLTCDSNQITCFPIFTFSITDFNISGNPATCLPNYIPAMDALTLAMPLCTENDFINNPNGCNASIGILGLAFNDLNSDCNLNSSDIGSNNIPIKLYDQNDSLLKQTFSAINGIYQFPEDLGTYTVKIDTTNRPFTILCQNNNVDTTVILTSQNSLADSIDFPIVCKPGFDVGTQSVLANGRVFPGKNHQLKVTTGDLSQFFNLSCASGISGQVLVSVSGPVNYQTHASGTLTPLINGNIYTYDIADFGTTDIFSSFGLIFQTDTTAQAGDQICVSVTVTPDLGDNNPSNNFYEFCYNVVNSYDPNMKEVYPINVTPTYDDYFTYTIHFQNTGTAPAMNIRLVDSLDANLDLETFQILNYSHNQTANVRNNVLTFHFPNIQLPDSTSNPEGSKGYVQYRIKPKIGLAPCTEIKNTAYIYFDYNAPIVTNSTTNLFLQNTVNIGNITNPSECEATDGSIQISGLGNGTLIWLGSSTGSISNFSLGNSVNNLSAGSYELIFNSSCSADTLEVTLQNPQLLAPIITSSDSIAFCEGDSIILSSSSPTGNIWSTGQTSNSIVVNTQGNYSVFIDNGICTSANSNEIITQIIPLPATPTITANGPTTFCDGNQVTLSSSSGNGNIWSTGETSQSIIIYDSQSINLMINQNECTSPAASIEITAHANPIVTLTSFNDICNLSQAFILTNGTPAGGEYAINGNPSIEFDPSTAIIGINSISYLYTDDNNCNGIAIATINVFDCLGEQELDNSTNISVYPNPFSSSTTVAFGLALTNADIHLYNVYGQEVRKISNFSGSKLSLLKESLTPGIYFLQIRNEEHSQKIKLMITE